jgi:DNA-binding MarR family transcriptional regulator
MQVTIEPREINREQSREKEMPKAANPDLSWLKHRPEDCVFRHVSRVSRGVTSAFDAALAKDGVTAHQLNILFTLAKTGPIGAGELARVIGMDASTLTRGIQTLIADGLVNANPGPDRRTKILTLSASGAKRLSLAARTWDDVQDRITKQMGQRAWRNLTGALGDLNRAAVKDKTHSA